MLNNTWNYRSVLNQSGLLLIGSSSSNPQAGFLTSSNGTLSYLFGSGSINIDLNIPVTVGFGGTGRTILTVYGVVLGEGSNSVNVTAPGTNGQLLVASTTGDPKFSTVTSSGNTVTFTFGPNSLNIEVSAPGFTFANPWPVINGGTGRTALTAFGVLLGEGSNNVNVTAAGTDGQVLIGSSTGDPKFNTVTSALGTLTFSVGHGTLSVDLNVPVTVGFGGTGRTILTTYGVLLGEGSNNINVTDPGTNGQLLIASTTGDPKFVTVTSSGNTVTFTFGPNSLNIEVSAPGFTFANPWPVSNGGTGRTALTAFGVLLGEGSNNVNVTAAGTDGQVLIGSSTGDPKFNTVTSALGTLTFSVGHGSLNIDLNIPVTVGFGGTGRTILTTYGVLLGEGSNNINVTAPGTNGQVLIASTTGDPKFTTITSSSNTVTFTFGPNSLNIEVSAPGFTFANPWPVSNGGTGRTALTAFGVLLGEGSNNVNVTAAGTDGQVLIGSSTGDPKFNTVTSALGTLTFSVGHGSLNVDLNVPVTVGFGGTGRTILTTYGVLLGEGSNNINVTAPGTNGQVLIASTTGDPKFTTITSSGNTVTFTFGPNSLNIEVSAPGFTFANPWPVINGGTGRTALTAFGVLLGEGSNNVNVTAPGTNGQLLIASTTGDPKFVTVTSSSNTVTFTFGPNSLNIEVSAPGFTFANPWPVSNGGTGRTALTAFGVLLGEGSNNVNVTAAGTDGQVLIGSSTGDPKFNTITSSLGSLTFAFGHGSLNIDLNAPVSIANGGTNATTFGSTISSVIYFNGTSLVPLSPGSSGQVLQSQGTGVAPVFGAATPLLPITFVTSGTSYAVSSTDYFLSVSSDIARTITLAATTTTGRVVVVKDRTGNAQSNNITVQATSGTVTIDGGPTYKINVNYASIQLLFDGTVYQIF